MTRMRNRNWSHAGLLIAIGAALQPAAAAQTKTPVGPLVVFSIHGIFKGVTKDQGHGSTSGWIDSRTTHLTLPTGDYWVYADFVIQDGGTFCNPHFSLLGADGKARQGEAMYAVGGNKYGRVGQEITLASPFSGTVSYGSGGFKPEEIWFRVVPAKEKAFLPFAFGTAPKPLKKGEPGVHGTLAAQIGDYYYLQLPAGYWRFILKASIPPSTEPLPKAQITDYNILLDLLDERGITSPQTFLSTGFLSGGSNRAVIEKVIKVDAPEFVKLLVRGYVSPAADPNIHPKPEPLAYTLSVESAASGYQPDTAGH